VFPARICRRDSKISSMVFTLKRSSRARDRIPDEFGLRSEALFLGRRRKQLRLLFRKFEAYCLHTNCNTVVFLSSIDGHCESEERYLLSHRLEPRVRVLESLNGFDSPESEGPIIRCTAGRRICASSRRMFVASDDSRAHRNLIKVGQPAPRQAGKRASKRRFYRAR